MKARFDCVVCGGEFDIESEDFAPDAVIDCPHCAAETPLIPKGNPIARARNTTGGSKELKLAGAFVMTVGAALGGIGFASPAPILFWGSIPVFLLGLILFVVARFQES